MSQLAQTTYVISIGVNQPPDASSLRPLSYAERDATALYHMMRQRGVSEENSCLLTGTHATLAAITTALGRFVVNSPRRNDCVIVYFAGHGVPLPEDDDEEDDNEYQELPHSEVFLVTSDFDEFQLFSDRSFRFDSALGFVRLRNSFFERTRSEKVLFLFDCCYSGQFLVARYPRIVESDLPTILQQRFKTAFAQVKGGGRVAIASCLPSQEARENAHLEHGFFTHFLLTALNGDAVEALDAEGYLSVGRLFDYLCVQMPKDQQPVRGGVEQSSFMLMQFPERAPGRAFLEAREPDETQRREKRERHLKALFADHRGFLRDRLTSFVGRSEELEEIRTRITSKLPGGGYITITGQAGQGKSSMIASLVEDYGETNVAYHFIPFNPGSDHQVGLLRNVIARLLLKHDLPEFYVASDNRSVLRDFFPKVLAEITAKGQQEVIFIDGLDQLQEDWNGQRDLSFLPLSPPPGIVFVLGTRPNDTLRPLELLEPCEEYRLPNFSRTDFDLLLQHHHVFLESYIADRVHEIMQANALFLDLMAEELSRSPASSPQALLETLATDPDHLFSQALMRLQRNFKEWNEVLKPLLGVLFVAQEPLTKYHLRAVLQIDSDRLHTGLLHLGGLVTSTEQSHYALFHLKWRDYLKEHVFPQEDERSWHSKLATWCEDRTIETIWQESDDPIEQKRREYARNHYITHLYLSQDWLRLFRVLDAGSYGRAKERWGFTHRSYIQDLALGEQATMWDGWSLHEQQEHLPRLWRYLLLRSKLKSRVDYYPRGFIQQLLLQGEEQMVLGLTEFFTDPYRKLQTLKEVAVHIGHQQGRETACQQVLFQAYELACSLENDMKRVEELRALALVAYQIRQQVYSQTIWQEAEQAAFSIEKIQDRVQALCSLATIYAQMEQWTKAQAMWQEAVPMALAIANVWERADTLKVLVISLTQAQCWKEAERFAYIIPQESQQEEALSQLTVALAQTKHWKEAERIAYTIPKADAWRTKSREFAVKKLAMALAFDQQWGEAERIIHSLSEGKHKALLLSKLALAHAQARQWNNATRLAYAILDRNLSEKILGRVVIALAQAKQWKEAEILAHSITTDWRRIEALRDLGVILAQSQQWERAWVFWEEAEGLIRFLSVPWRRVEVLSKFAASLAMAKQWKHASTLWQQAEQIAYSIQHDWQRLTALRWLTTALTRAGYWKEAERIARTLPVRHRYDGCLTEALSTLTLALIRAKQWKDAERIIYSFDRESAWRQTYHLEKIAHSFMRAKQWEDAQKYWLEAGWLSNTEKDQEYRATALSELTTHLFQLHQWQPANMFLQKAEQAIRAIRTHFQQFTVLKGLLSRLIEEKQWREAKRIVSSTADRDMQAGVSQVLFCGLIRAKQWEEASTIVHMMRDANYIAYASKELITALQHIVRRKYTGIPWKEVEQGTRSAKDHWYRTFALNVLSETLAQAGQWKEAEQLASILFQEERDQGSLGKVAIALAQAKQWKEAERIAFSLERVYKDEALSQIAKELASTNQWKESDRLIRSITSDEIRVKALSQIATILTVQKGRGEHASTIWKEAEDTARSLRKSSQERALCAIGVAMAKSGQWVNAERIAHSSGYLSEVSDAIAAWLFANARFAELVAFIQRSWRQIETHDQAYAHLSLASYVIALNPQVAPEFLHAIQWVDEFLRG